MKPYGSLARLNDERIETFRDGIRMGLSWSDAVALLGITRQSWHEARKDFLDRFNCDDNIDLESLQELKPELETTRDKNILTILTIERGPERVEGEMKHLQNIERFALDGNWRASAWWLEHVRPDRYGPKPAFDLATENTGPLQIVWDKEQAEEIVQVYRDAGII